MKKLYPSASYEVKKFNGLPYVYDPITGFMVYTSVTIEGVSHEMWLPVSYTHLDVYKRQIHKRPTAGMLLFVLSFCLLKDLG